MILRGSDITKPIRETADVCIIGSGCGGGPVAKILAEAGKRVIVVEAGSHVTPEEFVLTEESAFSNLYQQRAGQATEDQAVLVLQGKAVGGSTVINWTTSLRTPDFVLDAWQKRFGVQGISPKEIEPYFERVEKYLNIHAEPDERHNNLNRVILDGAKKLGYRAHANGRNVKDCNALGACGVGCPIGAKQTVDLTYIADAIKSGTTVFANCHADTIKASGKTKRVTGSVIDPVSHKAKFDFSIEAPVVVVAASAIHSPVLLLKSGVANSSGEVGKHLTFHLTTAVLGVFDRPMYPWKGIPQSAMCDEFLNKSGDGGGFWIESVPATAALAGLSMSGFGKRHRAMIRSYPNVAASIVLVKEIDSEGRVIVNSYGRPSISYKQGWKDLQYLKQGLKEAAKIHIAAGANEVYTLHTKETRLTSVEEIDKKLSAASYGTNEIAFYSAHPLGTCRMGEDPRASVVNSHGETHDVKGLFVIDGSITCTSLGVNPQVTLLALAEKHGEWLAENWKSVA
ncbi:MAG: GMC family oxidoreductase [Ignavibacteriales bacterium]|nr:GMC family oxidoreductase [Ignavibacteriales bacterium]